MRSGCVSMLIVVAVTVAALAAGCGGGGDRGGFASCGNGIVDPGEECDDGNLVDTDGCLSTCELNVCGDGVLNTGVEQCDGGQLGVASCQSLGFATGNLACTAQCTFDTSRCGGTVGSPAITPTPAPSATTAASRLLATPTAAPTPAGANCSAGDQVVVVASLSEGYGGAQIDLGYPSSAVNLPGTGSASTVAARVVFAAADGLTAVSDHGTSGGSVDDTLTASVVSSSDHPAGTFVTVTFDCIAGEAPPAGASFACTVVSASTAAGDTIADERCSVAVQ